MTTHVLVSGGVDSSVALHRLARAGDDTLRAYYLKIWLEDELSHLGDCPWQEDLEYVRGVCDPLGIAVEVVPLQREYWDRVVAYTIAELRAGRTPSPDIFCNQRIKFGAFVDGIGDSNGRIATGHYARIDRSTGRARLLKGLDPVKDQTYFLSHLSYAQLERCDFPIGHLPKPDVRRLAEEYDLPNRDRRDSQGICFLGKIPFNEFVEFHLGERSGPIIELETGRRLGEHRGYWFHTIGQRKGLGLSQGPWFVVDKSVDDNTVWVSHRDVADERARDEFDVAAAHWIDGEPLASKLTVKLRHSPTVYDCEISSGEAPGTYRVRLAVGDPGIAAGQFAVFYDGDHCLGGSVIAGVAPARVNLSG